MDNKKVYIAGALTHATQPKEIRQFYEQIGEICAKLGCNPYIPHLVTDPCVHREFSPQEVFQKDKAEVLSSSLLIAYVGETSIGVGIEIAFAESANIPIIMIYEKGVEVSRFARGAPTIVAEIIYSSKLDALLQLFKTIAKHYNLSIEGRIGKHEILSLLSFSNRVVKSSWISALKNLKVRWANNLIPKLSQ